MQQQGLLTGTHRALLAVLAVGMAIRGLDYLIIVENSRPLMPRFDPGEFLPPQVWGFLCLAAAAVILAGVVAGHLHSVAFGCFFAGVVNLMLCIPMLTAVLTPPVDDFRIAADYLVKTAIWWIVSIHTLKAGVIASSRRALLGGGDGT